MPVVVVGAETPLGRAVVARLKADGGEIRAVVERAADDLGVPTLRTDWRDDERLGAACEGAHTIVVLPGPRRLGDVDRAARDGGVRRIIVLVKPGTSFAWSRDDHVELVPLPDRRRRWFTRRAVIESLADAIVAADARR